MRIRTLMAALAVVGLAACGSSSGTKASSTNTTAKASTEVSASGAFTSQQCLDATKEMADVAAKMPEAMSGQPGDLEASIKSFQDLANASPSEIRADMKIVADAYAKFARAMADAKISAGGTPSQSDIQKLAAAAQSVNTSEFMAASQRIQDWFTNKCGK